MILSEMIREIPTIELEKINLRRMRNSDATDLFQYYNNKNVYQYLDWNGPNSIKHAEEIIDIWNKGFEENWIMRFAIADKNTDKIIGTIFLNSFDGKRAEIGYELSEEFWRKGIMSEAMKAVLTLGFDKLQLKRIQAFVCAENIGSKEILMKFGFEEEGYLRQYETHSVTGQCNDMYIYGLLKEEFKF
ncbi:GNAT family protein [Clostridium sp.]|uniref:GNAT family N-acetyltransferase n=1 Tax=Clostridium sp. TaxID=1506 RepID=UPI003217B250